MVRNISESFKRKDYFRYGLHWKFTRTVSEQKEYKLELKCHENMLNLNATEEEMLITPVLQLKKMSPFNMTQARVIWKRELRMTGLWTSPWSIFLTGDWCRRTHLVVGGAILGLVFLGVIRKRAEQVSKRCSSPPWPPHPILPPCSSPKLQAVKWNEPFPSQVAFGYGVLL